MSEIEECQPGDIVVFGSKHIGIISEKRNEKEITYLLHNRGQLIIKEDVLEAYNIYNHITGIID